jgi:hypothetical protein
MQTMREETSLYIADLSDFARNLRRDLTEAETAPGHLALMGLIARAAGYRNYQHLKAEAPPPAPNTGRALERARVFDGAGQMQHWPAATGIQGLCLWVFWDRMPPRQALTEAAVNAILKDGHLFGDHVLLRRSLIDHRLVTREVDGSAYRRIEQAPPPEARALIRAVRDRALQRPR